MNIAIIPARGGSKRIPGKNIKDFLGKPIIAYSIEAALETKLFDEVMVSTDDRQIAEIAMKYGANVPFLRSEKNSNDHATTVDVLLEVLQLYKENLNQHFTYGCCLYPTAPLIKSSDVKNGFIRLTEGRFKSVFPVVAFSYPVWRGMEVTDEGLTRMVWPEYINARSQDLKKVYHDAGQWYWFDCDVFRKEATMFTDCTSSIVINEEDAHDIDNDSDWQMAELKFKVRNAKA